MDWSELTRDLLRTITSLLCLPDHHRFSAVCHKWRVVAKEKLHPATKEPPWLVLGEDEKTKKRKFFNVSEQRLYSIDIPELYGQYICGSSHGWLFTIDNRDNGRLVNPFTRVYYDLPSYPPSGDQTKLVHKAVLSHDPSNRLDFIAMILYGDSYIYKPAMWRPGDTDWAVVRTDSNRIEDLIYFEDKFYALTALCELCEVHVGSNLTIMEPTLRIFPYWYTGLRRWYLVNFEGKLLLVWYQILQGHTKRFLVTMLNLKEGTLHWLDDIDGLALLVSDRWSVVVDPTNFPDCTRNGIYFGDIDMTPVLGQGLYHDFGVYDMVKDTTVRDFCPTINFFHPPAEELTWFTPNS